jgi:hypothetical protein
MGLFSPSIKNQEDQQPRGGGHVEIRKQNSPRGSLRKSSREGSQKRRSNSKKRPSIGGNDGYQAEGFEDDHIASFG